ncbi:hypothetical protein AAIH70_29975 [Neorhizobium sp. BT27B]|uniref:hypothetical protein n=1 Tax=Neorhizobium sp. BT27B TaxID=3142625 RepID=UPI003D278A69
MSGQSVYTVEQFRKEYALFREEAERIFNISGPSRTNLDVFMKVYRRPKSAEQLLESDR